MKLILLHSNFEDFASLVKFEFKTHLRVKHNETCTFEVKLNFFAAGDWGKFSSVASQPKPATISKDRSIFVASPQLFFILTDRNKNKRNL